jgi:hypothetical protein
MRLCGGYGNINEDWILGLFTDTRISGIHGRTRESKIVTATELDTDASQSNALIWAQVKDEADG